MYITVLDKYCVAISLTAHPDSVVVFSPSRRKRPYLYRKRAIHRSRPAYSLKEVESLAMGPPCPPLNSSNSFMSRRERSRRLTMSVWEQRTSQLRRHRHMSSREILFSNPNEEQEAPPGCPHHLKATGSLKLPVPTADPKAFTAKPPKPMEMPLEEPALSMSVPELHLSSPLAEPPDPTDTPLPDPPTSTAVFIPEPTESEPCPEGKRGIPNHCHQGLNGRRSPWLNGERRQRAVRKFRPPASDTLSIDMEGLWLRRPQGTGHCEAQAGARGLDSPQASEGSSRSVSMERKTPEDPVEEVRKDGNEGETSQPSKTREAEHR